MTGPEHFREAARLLRTSDTHGPAVASELIAAAQVHATLAAAWVGMDTHDQHDIKAEAIDFYDEEEDE